jgi:hypothetical protein
MLHGLRVAIFSLVSISLLINIGCKPNKQRETPKPAKPETDSNAKTDDSGTIKGRLDSVDWDSLVGQEVTIGGDLVVVDTYDLVRRGQIKVARDRIYIRPTGSIPTTPIPIRTHSKAAATWRVSPKRKQSTTGPPWFWMMDRTNKTFFHPNCFPTWASRFPPSELDPC